MRDNDVPDHSRQQPDRQSIVIVGRLKGHTRVDDRDIYLVDVPGYIDWIDWCNGGD